MEVSEPPQTGKQLLLERLLVFHGSFTLNAAEFVCGGSPLSKSLVKAHLEELCHEKLVLRCQRGRINRYDLWIEDVEQRRDEAFSRTGMGQVRQRHLIWCKKHIESLGKSLKEEGQEDALDKMQQDLGNLRAALAWSLRASADGSDALSLMIASYRFWHVRSHEEEGLEWILQAIEKAADLGDERMLRASNVAGLMYSATGKYEESNRMYRKTLALARRLGDRRAKAIALSNMAHNDAGLGKVVLAIRRYENCIRVLEELDERDALSSVLCNYSILLISLREFDRARGLLDRARAMDLRNGDLWGLNTLNLNIAEVHLAEGKLDNAEDMYCETLQTSVTFSDLRTASESFSGLARVAVARRSYTRATILLGAAAFTAEMGSKEFRFVELTGAIECSGACHDNLGEARYDEAWDKGYGMPFEDAVAYAVGSLSGL